MVAQPRSLTTAQDKHCMSRTLRIFQVDAFTGTPFTGNPPPSCWMATGSRTSRCAVAREFARRCSISCAAGHSARHDLAVRFSCRARKRRSWATPRWRCMPCWRAVPAGSAPAIRPQRHRRVHALADGRLPSTSHRLCWPAPAPAEIRACCRCSACRPRTSMRNARPESWARPARGDHRAGRHRALDALQPQMPQLAHVPGAGRAGLSARQGRARLPHRKPHVLPAARHR
jgi:hypothetical protein